MGNPGNKMAIAVALAVIIAAGGGTLYFRDIAEAKQVAEHVEISKPLTIVDVYALALRQRPTRISARGVLEGIQETVVSAEVEGRVVSRPIAEGQVVEIGDVLCQIETTMHDLAVQASKARLQEAQAGLVKAEADLERVMSLDAQHTTSIEQRTYESARDRTLAARDLFAAQLKQARERFDRCTIRSPIRGQIAAVSFQEGELLTPMRPVAEIVNLDEMKLVVDLPDFEVPQLGEHPRISVTCDSYPGETFTGHLRAVYPKANPLTRRVPLEIRVDNSEGKLRSGIFVNCRIESGHSANKLLVPASAVMHELGADYCLVAQADDHTTVVRRRNVEAVPVPGSVSWLEIAAGLEKGDLIILNKHQEVAVDQAVATRSGSPPGRD